MTGPEPPAPERDRFPAAGRGRAFAAPWEAEAFALALLLHDRGVFTWSEWAETLAAEIARPPRLGETDDGRGYYGHWLAALERLVVAKGLASAGMLSLLRERWAEAARATPHG